MRFRNGDFGIFPRCSRKTVFYYYWLYDSDGKRKYRSTGKKDYNDALQFCRTLSIKGQLYNGTSYSFDFYSQLFFDYEKCPYIRSRLLRGYSYGRTWAKRQRSLLVKIIHPYFKDTDIRTVSPQMIDRFLFGLREKEINNKTLNHIITTIKAIFAYAKITGVIEINPTEGIKPFRIVTKEKGIFSRDELIELFCNSMKSKIWTNPMHFLINCIAATTGLRLGEILALKSDSINTTNIKVDYSWNRIEGLKSTKSGKSRIVPISIDLSRALFDFIEKTNINGFLFSANSGKTPIDHKVVYKSFFSALSKIGIDTENKKIRNISFHSYRHTFNTLLLEAGVHPETLRLITGHSSVNMTERYSHVQLNNMPDIIKKLPVIDNIKLLKEK